MVEARIASGIRPRRSIDYYAREREKEILEAALAECQGRVSGAKGAAKKLGIPRQTLDARIASLGIDKYRFKTR